MVVAFHEQVLNYLRSLAPEQRRLVGSVIRSIQDTGVIPGSARQIKEKLWELKPGFHRIFYVVTTGPVMHLLHAVQKDTQKARPDDVKIARARMNKLLAK